MCHWYIVRLTLTRLNTGVFIGSFVTQYNEAVSKTFLSPTTSSPGTYCTVSKNMLTLKYRVDRSGCVALRKTAISFLTSLLIFHHLIYFMCTFCRNWEGSNGYNQADAIYEIEFKRVQLDSSSYRSTIEFFREETKRVSDLAEERGHSFLLAALSAYTTQFSVGGGTVQFYAVGDASYIYDTYVDSHLFLSRSQMCLPSNGSMTYDKSTSSFVYSLTTNRTEKRVTYSGGGYSDILAADEVCPGMFNLDNIYSKGLFSSESAPETFDVRFDIRSIATIIGIHYNITSLGNLLAINNKLSVTIGGIDYSQKEYVDPYYDGMIPILCTKYGKKVLCVLQINKLYYLPVITKAGNFSEGSGSKCFYDEYIVECNKFDCQGQIGLAHYIGLITVDPGNLDIANNFGYYADFQSQVFDLLSWGLIASFSGDYESDVTTSLPGCSITTEQFLNKTFTNLFSFSGKDLTSGYSTVYNQTTASQLTNDDGDDANDGDDTKVTNEFALMIAIIDNKGINHYSIKDSSAGIYTVGLVIDKSGVIYPYSRLEPKYGINSTYHNELYAKTVFDVIADSPPASLLLETMICTTSPSSAAIGAIGVSISNATQAANFGFILMVTIFMMYINRRHKSEKKPLLMKLSAKNNLNILAEIGILEEVVRHAHGVNKDKCLTLLDGIKMTTMLEGQGSIEHDAEDAEYIYENKARDNMIEMNLVRKKENFGRDLNRNAAEPSVQP